MILALVIFGFFVLFWLALAWPENPEKAAARRRLEQEAATREEVGNDVRAEEEKIMAEPLAESERAMAARNAGITEYKRLRDEVIAPVLNAFADRLTAAGHRADVSTPESHLHGQLLWLEHRPPPVGAVSTWKGAICLNIVPSGISRKTHTPDGSYRVQFSFNSTTQEIFIACLDTRPYAKIGLSETTQERVEEEVLIGVEMVLAGFGPASDGAISLNEATGQALMDVLQRFDDQLAQDERARAEQMVALKRVLATKRAEEERVMAVKSAAITEYKRLRDNMIAPVLNAFADRLTAAGHRADVSAPGSDRVLQRQHGDVLYICPPSEGAVNTRSDKIRLNIVPKAIPRREFTPGGSSFVEFSFNSTTKRVLVSFAYTRPQEEIDLSEVNRERIEEAVLAGIKFALAMPDPSRPASPSFGHPAHGTSGSAREADMRGEPPGIGGRVMPDLGRKDGVPTGPQSNPKPPQSAPEMTGDMSMTNAGAPDPYIGRTIGGKIQILELLGGKVFKAKHEGLGGKIVCVKTLKRSLNEDPTVVGRFEREAKAAGRLNHPNSIQVIDSGQDEYGSLYIVMEYVSGKDLRKTLHDDFPLGEERICHIMSQVLSAASDMHAMNVIHRDLKPEHIMLEQRRNEPDFVKVIGFGKAKIQEANVPGLTRADVVCGTPLYMSPEQATGSPFDARADLYAIGVILYQLTTGTLPFDGANSMEILTKHVTELPIPPRLRRPEVAISPEMEALILRALEKEPSGRPASAEEFRRDLLAIQDKLKRAREGSAKAVKDAATQHKADRIQAMMEKQAVHLAQATAAGQRADVSTPDAKQNR